MKNKIFLVIFLSLFIFYIILLVAEQQGYYKNRNEKAKILTEEQIIEFEKDIENGKNIDIRKYVLYESKDYSNKLSNKIYRISLKLEEIVNDVVKIIFTSAEKAVSD